MLHSRTLRYLDEIARRGSIRAAGEKLNVASSAINKHLLQLEEAIGEPLFERLPRGVRPTAAGDVLIAHVRRTLTEFRRVEAEIRDLKSLQGGEVIIATMSGLAGGIVAKAAVGFCGRHPELRITIRVMSTPDLLRAVVGGEADLGLGFNLAHSPQLERLWEMDASLGAVISPRHALARHEAVRLADCAAYPLVFAEPSMFFHGIIAGAFVEAGLFAEPTFRTNSIEAMKSIAAAGESIAFLCRFDIADEERHDLLTYRPIRDRAFSKNILSLVRRDKHGRGPANRLVAEEILSELAAVLAA